MKNRKCFIFGAAVVGMLSWSMAPARAVTVTLTGDFVRATFTDRGVLSNLFYDSTGTRNFGVNDYIAPGTPFEAFGVRTATSGFQVNSNSGSANITGSNVSSTGGLSGGSVTWTGSTASYEITQVFTLGNSDERIDIQTTITALTDLTNVRVSRAVDPDPDVNVFNNFSTVNQRGNVGLGLAASDFVGSAGAVSGLPLGLFFSGPIAHNTGISSVCCGQADPDFYLAGGNLGNSSTGDHGIGIAFNLGNLSSGESTTWTYAYVMGGSIDDVDTGGGDRAVVPEPATATMGLLALGGLMLRRRRTA